MTGKNILPVVSVISVGRPKGSTIPSALGIATCAEGARIKAEKITPQNAPYADRKDTPLPRIDSYKHLNEIENKSVGGVGIEIAIDQIVNMNYGAHRALSAMVHSLRKRWGQSELADRIETILNEGIT